MYLFKTSGQTFQSVISNQKHAFRGKPSEIKPGELILVSKNRADLVSGEKQIQYTMKYEGARPARNIEVEQLWPGNPGRWNWIIDCYDTHELVEPFDLEEVIGHERYHHYRNVMTFSKILPEDEELLDRALAGTPLKQSQETNPFFDEEEENNFSEGAMKKVYVNRYERDPAARSACIDHFGVSCSICGFDFEVAYGDMGRGYIQVHHKKPLGEIGEKYSVNPIEDLIPVCPNCHAMLHSKRPALREEDVRSALND